MKKLSKILCLLLALALCLSMAACTTDKPDDPDTPDNPDTPDTPVAEEYAIPERDDSKVYDASLGEYYAALQEAQAENKDVNRRFALMAYAEAKLLESAVYLPASSNGGQYAISRVAPNTVDNQLWGEDAYRYQTALIATEFIKSEDRAEMKAKYAELKGTGTYHEWAKQFLTDKGYTLKDTYSLGYSSDPQTWDLLATYRSADSEAIINTMNFLVEYDCESIMRPALAESWTVSEDGLTYTFKLREGLTWVDYQGRKVADLTADDFVAGMQHLLDAQGGLEGLLFGVIKNAQEYCEGDITDFAEVGVKAVDATTLEYTLCQPTTYFMSMLSYNPFAPMSRTYYQSQGGKFGAEFDSTCKYGTTFDTIAYCGPYLVTGYAEKNSIVFTANDTFWNKDNIDIKKIVWNYNDGSDITKAYKDAVAGTLDGAGLNTTTLPMAKEDGYYDKYHYVSATDATSFGTFTNLNRQAFVNLYDESLGTTTQTDEDKERTFAAVNNVHFRRAISFALDRGAYNGATVGDELKLNSVINSYTPGNFVQLDADTTVTVGGKEYTFKAGTYYGAMMQAFIDADGVKFKVWDPEAEDGLGSSAGFDGWYNVDNAVEELNLAIADLEKVGVTVDADHPIYLDLPYASEVTQYANRAAAYKQSVEDALGKKVIINMVDVVSLYGWYYAGYYCDEGKQCDYDLYDCSGWGPDYGDPQTYLNTLQPDFNGDMTHCLGIF